MARKKVRYPALEKINLPKHVAIIMDGNGRWAKKKHLPRAYGHREGTRRVKDMIRMSSDIGLSALTVYAFSTENWKRTAEEVGVLMSLLVEFLKKELAEMCEENVVFHAIGNLDGLPFEVQQELRNTEEATRENTGLHVCVAVNYGGREEIFHAAKQMAQAYAKGNMDPLTPADFERHLYTHGLPDPDLIIRTSGEERLSNYLLYQSAYAEFYFTKTLWPDFHEEDYEKALLAYARRERRFGARE